jgi:hypothetical protein
VRRVLFGAKLERADNERVIALRDQMHFGTSLKRGRSAGQKLSWPHEQFRPSAGRDRGLPFGASQREGKARDKTFPRFGPHNPLKSIVSDERIQGNQTLIIEALSRTARKARAFLTTLITASKNSIVHNKTHTAPLIHTIHTVQHTSHNCCNNPAHKSNTINRWLASPNFEQACLASPSFASNSPIQYGKPCCDRMAHLFRQS